MSSSAFKTRIALVVFALLLCAELAYANDAIVAYRSNTGSCGTDPATNCPKIRFWDSSDGYWGSWGSEIELPNSGSTVRYVRVTQAPIATKTIIVTQSVDSYLDAYVCMMDCDDPSSWTVTNDIAKVSGNDRLFDVIFETNTGRALVVYAVDSSNPSRDLGYKVLPLGETSFTGLTEYYIDDSTTGSDIKCNWVRLDRSTTDGQEIIVTAQDDTNKDINAWVWDGSSWGHQIEISTDAPTTSENLAVRYAFNESMGMVIGANGTSGGINYRYWDGSSWSSVGTFSVVSSSSVSWTNLKEDPSTDDLQAIIIDGAKTLHAAYWNGSTWSVTSNIDPDVDGLNTRTADFAWQSTGSTGRLVWDTDGSGTTLSQRACSPQCTGNTTTISTYGKVGNFLTIERNPVSNVKILGIRLNEQNNIGSFSFNGTDYHNYGDSVITSKGQTGFEIQSVSFQISDLKPVVECMVINTSGKYKVFKNLYGAPNDASPLSDYVCIKIAVSDVDFDCNGYNITDNGTMGVTYGVLLNGSISNITVKNCAGVSQYDYGLYSYYSNDVNLDNNVLYDNTVYGLVLDNSDNVNATTTHLYDNGQGAIYVTTGSTPRSIDLSSLIIDKPLDNYKKYTNLTISDTVEANTAYSIDWVSRPTLPLYMASFADKFVNITDHNGTVSIDSIVWNWLDSELTTTLANYDESNFELWKHNSTWNMLNDSPDTSANTLSLSGENPPGIYGILQSDSTPPDVTIYSPTNSTYNTNTVALNFTVTDDVAVDTCKYNLDGMSSNVTLPVCQNTTLGPLADGPHYVTVYANDTAGNTGSDTEYFFTDATPPVVTIYSPMNTTYNTSMVALNYTATDNIKRDSCWYSLDGGTNISLATCQNITLDLADGPHNVTVYANDTAGNVGSDTEYFTVDTVPPSVDLNSPADDSYLNSTSVDFNFTASDNIDTSLNCSLYLDGLLNTSTSAANNTPTIVSLTGLSEGSHNWSVSCTDDAGNTGTSATWDFTVDVTAPLVNLVSPSDDECLFYYDVDLEFYATDSIASILDCSLYLDDAWEASNSSTLNKTNTVFSVLGLSDGLHSWYVNCTDDANNTGMSATWYFIVDTTPPLMEIQSPTNSTYSTDTIPLNYTATDDNLVSCFFELDGVANYSIPNCQNTTLGPLADGPHNVSVTADDCAGNTGSSMVYFTVDTTPPNVSIQFPTNTTYTTNILDLNYTATDTNLDSCWYYLDGSGPTSLPDCESIPEGLGPLADGPYNLTVYANDTAGNEGSDSVIFTISVPKPPPDDGDGEKKRMYVSYSFVCPGDEVVFNVTRAGGLPVANAEVRVVYDEPPLFGLVDVLDTDSEGIATIVLSEEGTYLVRAERSGYYTVGATFNFELCPECYEDDDCGGGEQCSDGECVPVECDCGYVEDHQCIAYECCADSECPEGQACIDHACGYECYSDEDCDTTEYCEIPEGAVGGLCEPVTGMCGYAENHLWNFYECGDEPECPTCPEGTLCENHVCMERSLDCPDVGFVGSEQVCHATENNDSCKFCYVRVTHPDGTVVLGNTDEEGNFSVVLSQVGVYNVTLMVDGTVVDEVVIESLPTPLLLEAQRQFLYDFCLPLLLILLLLLLLWFLWKRSRKDIYAKVLTKKPALGAPVQVMTMSRKKEKPVKGVLVAVYHKGKLLASGKSNKFGKFTFTPQAKGKYKIHVLNREKPDVILEL